MRWEKTARLLRLARALAGSAEGLTLDEMAREAGCDRRTAERMRDALSVLFPQLEELVDGRSKRFRIPGGLDSFMQAPSADELAELEAAARSLDLTGAGSRTVLLRALGGKVRAALRSSARRRIEPDLEALLAAEGLAMQAGPRPIIAGETLATLRDALKAREACRFRYAGRGWRRVEPWGLLLGRMPYLVGPATGRTEPVLWRLDRMSDVSLDGPSPGPPADFDLAEYAGRSFGAYQEEPEGIVLRFRPEVAGEARAFLFHPTQALSAEPDGGLRVGFRAGGLLELVRHLFTWGDAVEIVAPARLRAMMVDELRRALARHDGAPPRASRRRGSAGPR